jgi:hypothetical protein
MHHQQKGLSTPYYRFQNKILNENIVVTYVILQDSSLARTL